MTNLKDEVVFGGLYKYTPSDFLLSYEQTYGQAIPCIGEDGNLYMLDTYQIERSSDRRGVETIQNIYNLFSKTQYPEIGQRYLSHSFAQYYHDGYVKIRDHSDLSNFEFVCSLNDYKKISSNSKEDYNREDVITGVKLFFECGYEWRAGSVGWTLVRKSASINKIKSIMTKLQDAIDETDVCVRKKYINTDNFYEDLQTCEDNGEIVPLKAYYMLKELSFNLSLADSVNAYIKSIKKSKPKYEYNYEFETCDKSFEVGQKWLRSFLLNDEDVDRFVYVNYGIDNFLSAKAVMIYEDESTISFVFHAYDCGFEFPQIAILSLAETKVSNLEICEVTEHNLRESSDRGHVDTPDLREISTSERELNSLVMKYAK